LLPALVNARGGLSDYNETILLPIRLSSSWQWLQALNMSTLGNTMQVIEGTETKIKDSAAGVEACDEQFWHISKVSPIEQFLLPRWVGEKGL
jgi:hypothetical protein